MSNRALASTVAEFFLAGEANLEKIVARATPSFGRKWRWLRPLARRYLKAFADKTRPRHREVVQFLWQDRGFRRVMSLYSGELEIKVQHAGLRRMQPAHAAQSWNVPVLESIGALADWLYLDPSELFWFADLKALTSKKVDSRLRHYHYRVLAKAAGSIRLIEAPKPRLKEVQRRILTKILQSIPLHPDVHGFVRGRSIETFAAPHVGQRVVLKMDLQDFFPTFSGARIQTFFRTAGYPEAVADLLGGLCSNQVPRGLWIDFGERFAKEFGSAPTSDTNHLRLNEARTLYARPHLPQGAPTSPALANICTYRLDCRLLGLAQSVGAQYTRYADDLAFSGDKTFEKCVERFLTQVAAIAIEEGFRVHHRKTRIMRQGVRQYLAGVVTNRHINAVRADFDRLKAILTNCVRQGPESQNREAHPHFRQHLLGRISFVEMLNPAKGERLRTIFPKIHWPP